MKLLQVAIAPILIVLFYIYIRDKYEKEPYNLLVIGLLLGTIITAPILIAENYLAQNTPVHDGLFYSIYISFAVAAFVEEAFKFLIMQSVIWRNKNFNEKFDGIVYAVFISLGFAMVENIMYVFNPSVGGVVTGIYRSIFSIPAHAIYAVFMGYYLANAKFTEKNKKASIVKALMIPIIVHGLYDFILIYQNTILLILFIPFVLFMWVKSFRMMKEHIKASPFKDIPPA